MRNKKLFIAREERGWTQEKAAEKIGVSRITFARWEEKGVIPHLSTIQMASEAFKMTPDQLGFRKPARSPYLESDENVDRRQAIQEIGKLAGAVGSILGMSETVPHSDELERLVKTLTRPSSIDLETLHGLKKTTENYWRLRVLGTMASPGLLSAAFGQYRIVAHLLQGSLLPTTRAYLCAIASELALFTGMLLSTDLHQHDKALLYYQTSLAIAQQANNDTLYAAGLGRMGSLAIAMGKPIQARTLFHEAQRLVKQNNTFTLRAWLAAEEAEVQAVIVAQENNQTTNTCFMALEKAELFANQIGSNEDSFGMYFDASRIPAYQGSCNMRLHRPEEALITLEEALIPLEPFGALRRAVLLDLAEASIQATSIERACYYLDQSLEIITQIQSEGSWQRLIKLRQQLNPWSSIQAVQKVDEQISSLKEIRVEKESTGI